MNTNFREAGQYRHRPAAAHAPQSNSGAMFCARQGGAR